MSIQTPHEGVNGNDPLLGESLSLIKRPELVHFTELEIILGNIASEGKIGDFVKRVFSDEGIRDGRKFMICQILMIRYSGSFSSQEIRGLILLMGFYARINKNPITFRGDNVVKLDDPRVLELQVRHYVGDILRENNSLLSIEEATRILNGEPFSISGSELKRILGEIYPSKEY